MTKKKSAKKTNASRSAKPEVADDSVASVDSADAASVADSDSGPDSNPGPDSGSDSGPDADAGSDSAVDTVDSAAEAEEKIRREMEPDEAEVEQLAADFGELPPQAAAEIRKFLRKFLEVLAGQKILVRQCDEATARHEKMMRTLAEIDNIRKRTMEEVDLARKYAAEAFAISICDVRDCLEIAMESDPEKPDDLREGVSLTLRKLDGVMERHGVREVNPDVGAGFDPTLHQAVGKAADAPTPRNTVAVVVRKGYTIHERTLRPADVIVSIRNGDGEKSGGDGDKSDGDAGEN